MNTHRKERAIFLHTEGLFALGADGRIEKLQTQPDPFPYPEFKSLNHDGPKADGEQKRPNRFPPNSYEAKRRR